MRAAASCCDSPWPVRWEEKEDGESFDQNSILSPKRVLALLEVADREERNWGWSEGWWQESHGVLGDQLIQRSLPRHGMSSSVIFFLGKR